MDQRELKALQLAATHKLEPASGVWKVPSQSGKGAYRVVVSEDGLCCDCPAFEETASDCKHCLAVGYTIDRENGGRPVDLGDLVVRSQYRDWAAYTTGQQREREFFPFLLAELCSRVPQQPHTIGRPRLPMGDVAFSVVMKVFDRLSARRLASDVRAAENDGFIETAPSTTSIWRYMADPALTAVMDGLIEASSLSFKDETVFAADATGLGTRTMTTWNSRRHGRPVKARQWIKLHAICGVKSNVVTAAVITDSGSNDTLHLATLVERTKRNFQVDDVVADAGYSSKRNAQLVERAGATPFIPFRSNTVRPDNDGSAWSRMWQSRTTDPEDWLDRYHQRSNIESVFSMMKTKFGDDL